MILVIFKKLILVFIFNVSLITSMYLACFISGTTSTYAIFSTSYDIFTIYISMSFVFSGSTLHCYCRFLSQITLSGTQTVDSDVSVDRQFMTHCTQKYLISYIYIYRVFGFFFQVCWIKKRTILFAKHVMSTLLSHSYPEDLFYMHFLHIFR